MTDAITAADLDAADAATRPLLPSLDVLMGEDLRAPAIQNSAMFAVEWKRIPWWRLIWKW